MKITPLTIADIQTTDLIYYDPDFTDVCINFCKKRDIDCLPSLTDSSKFFEKEGDQFIEKPIPPERIVSGQAHIFDRFLLDRFYTYSLLFVMSNNQLSGVVHFCDYNKPVVHAYLYSMISAFERSLRELLKKQLLDSKKMSYEDIIKHLKLKITERRHKNIEKLAPFVTLYLSELIRLAKDYNVIVISEKSNALRNSIMHAHDLIVLDNAYHGDYIYTLDSFVDFFDQVNVLLQDYKKVNNRSALFEI